MDGEGKKEACSVRGSGGNKDVKEPKYERCLGYTPATNSAHQTPDFIKVAGP